MGWHPRLFTFHPFGVVQVRVVNRLPVQVWVGRMVRVVVCEFVKKYETGVIPAKAGIQNAPKGRMARSGFPLSRE